MNKKWGVLIDNDTLEMIIAEGADTIAKIPFPGYVEMTSDEQDRLRDERATLISSAPELLDTLKKVQQYLCDIPANDASVNIAEIVEAAIDKAEIK